MVPLELTRVGSMSFRVLGDDGFPLGKTPRLGRAVTVDCRVGDLMIPAIDTVVESCVGLNNEAAVVSSGEALSLYLRPAIVTIGRSGRLVAGNGTDAALLPFSTPQSRKNIAESSISGCIKRGVLVGWVAPASLLWCRLLSSISIMKADVYSQVNSVVHL